VRALYWAWVVSSAKTSQISRTRRVQLSTFKGNTMVNIREFYEKDGKVLPGKKVRHLTRNLRAC